MATLFASGAGILIHPPTSSTTSSRSSSSSSGRSMSKSFFGGLKERIRKRSPSPTHTAPVTPTTTTRTSAPAPASASAFATAPAVRSQYTAQTTPPAYTPSSRSRAPAGRPISINEAPPAYSDVIGAGRGLQARSSALRATSPARSVASSIITTPEDPYAFLGSFDTVFVIDDSGSMRGRSWREVREALRSITPICADHDSDGIDIYFLNHKSRAGADTAAGKGPGGYRGFKNTSAVEALFESIQPFGGTPTGTRLQSILKPYLQLLEANKDDLESCKPVNVIVITDGVPSDDVEGVLLNAARKLDKIDAPSYQIGVQFFQVGNEPGARDALKELDDGLSQMVDGGVRDIVDTVTWDGYDGRSPQALTGESILKVVLGAVVRRLDRR